MNRIRQQWESYRESVIPNDAGAIQVQECQRAFYAGACSILNIQCEIDEGMSDDDGVKFIESLHEECEHFVEHLLLDS